MSEAKFFQHDNVAVSKVVKQELVEATRKFEGTEYKIPRLVLTHELLSKLSNPSKPYDESLRQKLPEGESKLVKVTVDFVDYNDEKGKRGLARNLETLKVPDDWKFSDFVNNEDMSAPNINLIGKEFFLKVTIKEYTDQNGNPKESVFWNLHQYSFEKTEKAAVVPLSNDVAKRFQRNALGEVSDLRKALREEKAKKQREKDPALQTAAANDIPF